MNYHVKGGFRYLWGGGLQEGSYNIGIYIGMPLFTVYEHKYVYIYMCIYERSPKLLV